jgi:hypothetical protein
LVSQIGSERDAQLVRSGAQVASGVAHEPLKRREIFEHREPLVGATLPPTKHVEHRRAARLHQHLDRVAMKEDLVAREHGDRRSERLSAPGQDSTRVLAQAHELLCERRARVSLRVTEAIEELVCATHGQAAHHAGEQTGEQNRAPRSRRK